MASLRAARAIRRLLLLLALAGCVHQHAAAQATSAGDASAADTCAVSNWGGFTPCTRMGSNQFGRTHKRTVVTPGPDCPALTETLTCELSRPPKPADAMVASHQATTALMVALPLAFGSSLSWPQGVPASSPNATVTSELVAALAAGRQLWQQQASSSDLLTCTPFNGAAQVLKDAAPIVGGQGGKPGSAAAAAAAKAKAAAHQHAKRERALANARGVFAAAVKAAARTTATEAKRAGGPSSSSSAASRKVIQGFRDAIVVPANPADVEPVNGVLPPPSVDATASVEWSGGANMVVALARGTKMNLPQLQLANGTFQDGMMGLVPWLRVQASAQGLTEEEQRAAPVLQLSVSYDSGQQAATFTAQPPAQRGDAAKRAAPAPQLASHAHLLLPIANHLTGIYGLDLSSTVSKAALAAMPTSGAVVKTSAGGGVTQLALTLAGAWTPANLTDVLGLQVAPQQELPAATQGPFSVTTPTLLYNAVPSALYVAMSTTISALGVDGAPATLNLRPGGRAALALYEPCQPVSGLQLSDVTLHLGADGNLTGSAAGSLASTAVSAVATVSPSSAPERGAADDLSLVMTAETVAAGSLADVITIITHKPPAALLQTLRAARRGAQQEHPMQFSSVTLTYSSPKARRRREQGGGGDGPGAAATGFDMVAVPDVDAAPALKQILDAIGLPGDSLALRASGASAGFGLASQDAFTLQLPAPFSAPGPTMLSLDVSGNGAGGRDGAPPAAGPTLQGAMSAALALPGGPAPSALDLASVSVTAPTTVVGAEGEPEAGGADGAAAAAPGAADVPVTALLAGRTLSQVSIQGFGFLGFQTLSVSAAASFQPSRLLSLNMSGPVTAFGARGTAVFNASAFEARRAGAQQQPPAAAFVGRLPSIDLPLMARSLGARVPLGALGAQLRSSRLAYPSAMARRAAEAAGEDGEGGADPGAGLLDVAAELNMCGMASPVSFTLSAAQGGSFTATFVTFQINRALMPQVVTGVAAALRSAHKAVTAASAAYGNAPRLSALLDEAKAGLEQAKQQVAAATSTFESERAQASTTLGDAAVFAESAAVAYHEQQDRAGAALQAARGAFNRADAAFNLAKTAAYQSLNAAKQRYSGALAKYDAAVTSAQQRVDSLLDQSAKLRAAYNTANSRCSPAAQAAAQCKAAAAAWVEYRGVAASLDGAQTALQEAADGGAAAQELAAAKTELAARQAGAEAVLTGPEWAARAAASTQLDAALAGVAAAEAGPLAQQLQDAHDGLVAAQQGVTAVLAPAAPALAALAAAKGSLRAASAGVRAATAAAHMNANDLATAASDLSDILAALPDPAALARGQADPASAPDADAFVRMDRISAGVSVSRGGPLTLGLSYSGAVGAGDEQKLLSGRFQVEVGASSDDLSVLLMDLLRDDLLAAIRSSKRSLAGLL